MSLPQIERAGIIVEGRSVAGLETCLHLPGFRVALDMGHCPREVIGCPTVLFTHSHVDHLGAVATHCATRALQHMGPPTYIVPAETAVHLERLFAAWRTLDGSDMPCTIVPLSPGEEYELSREVVVRPFATLHRGPSQGYALVSRRRKLKPKYRGLTEVELRELRVSQGIEITSDLETVDVAFTGDTRIDVVENEELVRTARLLILETTFVDDRVSVAEARREGHVHLDELPPRAELFENEEILLMHFSNRYRAEEVVDALARKLPLDLRTRVTPMLDGLRP